MTMYLHTAVKFDLELEKAINVELFIVPIVEV